MNYSVENLTILGRTSFIEYIKLDYQRLVEQLKNLGYPVAYNTFKNRQSPPFITILSVDNDDLMADNINYKDIENFQIELYQTKYYPPVEKELDNLFKENGLAYDKSRSPIPDEDLYQTVYEISLI